MPKIRMLVVDDHQIVRDGLRMLLSAEADFEIVGEATTGRQAVALAEKLKPDVVLMDLAMPLLNGMEATRQITSAIPSAKVIVLSSYADDPHLHQTLIAGAIGYVLKHEAAAQLVKAIRDVQKGNAYFSPAVSRRMQKLQGAFPPVHGQPSTTRKVQLSKREAEVFQLIAEGLPSKQIADELSLSIKTVEKHRTSLMAKLNARCVADVVREAVARGAVETLSLELAVGSAGTARNPK